jgi:hypothetical protein
MLELQPSAATLLFYRVYLGFLRGTCGLSSPGDLRPGRSAVHSRGNGSRVRGTMKAVLALEPMQ